MTSCLYCDVIEACLEIIMFLLYMENSNLIFYCKIRFKYFGKSLYTHCHILKRFAALYIKTYIKTTLPPKNR